MTSKPLQKTQDCHFFLRSKNFFSTKWPSEVFFPAPFIQPAHHTQRHSCSLSTHSHYHTAMGDEITTQLSHKASNTTLLSKKSTFTIRENILLQNTPSQSPLPLNYQSDDEDDKDFFDPAVTYTVEYRGHVVHMDPIDWRHSSLLKQQIACCFYFFMLGGLADQTIGTLMPILKEHFDTSQTSITIIFMIGFVGYTTVAFLNETAHAKLGRRGVLMLGLCGPFLTYAVNSWNNRLDVFVGMYLFQGLGGGLVGSAVNVFLSSITDHNEMMGMLHGFYGLGSIISPPLVSWIAQKWGFQVFYILEALLYMIGFIAAAVVFRHETRWKYAYLTRRTSDADVVDEEEDGVSNPFSMLKNKVVLAFATYLFFYVGGELSIGSWLLTYLKEMKGMEQLEASIVVSWFWFGLTFGRMTLGFCTKKFSSEYQANAVYGWISWLTFSAYVLFSMAYGGDSYDLLSKPLVFVAGMFIGPLFPTASVVLLKLLPVHHQVSGVGIASSIGGSGSAIVPFVVGSISRHVGFSWLLLIIDVVLFVYCLVWAIVPRLAGSATSW